MKRQVEVERLIRLYGSDTKGWHGGKLQATCPFAPYTHSGGSDGHPSFVVIDSGNNHFGYKCMACGESGSMPKMIWRMAELRAPYIPESSALAYGIDEPEVIKTPVKFLDYSTGGKFSFTGATLRKGAAEQLDLIGVPYAKPKAEYDRPDAKLVQSWLDAPIPAYASRRGFTDVHKAWGLGYNERERRWVHVIRNVSQEIVGYTARLCWDKPHCFRCGELILGADGKLPHNCPSCKTSYVKYKHHAGPWRRDNLFGIERHVEGEPIFVTEGTTDALNLWRHGVRHPVAILGASLSSGQAQLIARRTKRVFAMGDGDDAGRAMNAEVTMLMHKHGIEVVTIDIPDGSDPADLSHEEIVKLVPTECFHVDKSGL